jgi:hypothetical protein
MVMGAGVFAIATSSMIVAQSPAAPRNQVLVSTGGLNCLQGPVQEEIVREIDDPHTGDRWLLMRSGQFPGGPGRLVLATAHRDASGVSGRLAGQAHQVQAIPVIHAGDRLIVEEHTAVVDAVLEARALNPATAGAPLSVRLTIGGGVVRVVALGPGRAALQAGKRP